MKIDPATEVPCCLGLFEILSGFVDVSDPCYSVSDVGCRATKIPTKNGIYVAMVVKTGGEEDEAGCCKVLEALLEDAGGQWVKSPYDIGVDSGQAGIFDSKHYKNDEIGRKWKSEHKEKNRDICENEPWYSMCCDLTCGKMNAGVIPHGVVSSSGYGDGGYDLWIRMEDKLATGFRIVFIDSEQEQEESEEP